MKAETLKRMFIFAKTYGRCHFCGDKLKFENVGWAVAMDGHWEEDHVFQHAKGGKNNADNYLPACTRCNRLRWHRTGSEIRDLLLLGTIAQGEIQRQTRVGRNLESLRRRRLDDNSGRRMSRALAQEFKRGDVTAAVFTERQRQLRRARKDLESLERRWIDRSLSDSELLREKAKVRRLVGMPEPTGEDVIAPPA